LKTFLIMLLVAICLIGWRSSELAHAIGIATSAQDPSALSIEALPPAGPDAAQRPMSAEEFAQLTRHDPLAYQKFIASYQPQERTEVDKLLNFFSRGEYE
jgi:hypothetical protein